MDRDHFEWWVLAAKWPVVQAVGGERSDATVIRLAGRPFRESR